MAIGVAAAPPQRVATERPQRGERISGRNRRPAFLAPGLLLFGALVGIWALRDLTRHLVLFLLLFAAAWCCYAFAVRLVLRSDELDRPSTIATMVVVGVAARLLLLSAAPTLSDDLYRYVWEGEVLAHGLSPYALPPAAPALAPFRDAIWPHVNNPTVTSPYPPLAQVVGLVEAKVFPHSAFGPKFTAMVFDLATWLTLCVLLRRRHLPLRRSLIYAWNPLVLLVFSLSGHNDSLMLFLLLAALAIGDDAPIAGGVMLGVAVLAKTTPLLALPLVWRKWGTPAALVTLVVIVAGYAPFILLGRGAVGSLPFYLATFADNDSIHAVIRELVAVARPDLAAVVAKGVTAALFGSGLLALLIVPRLRRQPLWWQVYVALALSLVLASTVHAWYVTWLLPFLALRLQGDDRWRAFRPLPSVGWFVFSALVALPYLTSADHMWHLWISTLEYVPLYLFLLLGVLRFRPLSLSGRS